MFVTLLWLFPSEIAYLMFVTLITRCGVVKDIKGKSFFKRFHSLLKESMRYPRNSVFCTKVRMYPRTIFPTPVVYTNLHFLDGKWAVKQNIPNNSSFISEVCHQWEVSTSYWYILYRHPTSTPDWVRGHLFPLWTVKLGHGRTFLEWIECMIHCCGRRWATRGMHGSVLISLRWCEMGQIYMEGTSNWKILWFIVAFIVQSLQ